MQVNGKLVFHYDLGDSEQTIEEVRRRLDDGRYHYVTFIRHQNNVTVQVDDFSMRFRSHGMCAPRTRFSIYTVSQRVNEH